MGEILSIKKLLAVLKNLKRQNKSIVLAGGCFDILHPGHVVFLEKAKKTADTLIVLLESDQKVKELKGISRPVHTQPARAKVLSALQAVDYVAKLPYLKFNSSYDQLIVKIRPNVIAATAKDLKVSHLQRSAKLSGAKLKFVTPIIGRYSTSRILNR